MNRNMKHRKRPISWITLLTVTAVAVTVTISAEALATAFHQITVRTDSAEATPEGWIPSDRMRLYFIGEERPDASVDATTRLLLHEWAQKTDCPPSAVVCGGRDFAGKQDLIVEWAETSLVPPQGFSVRPGETGTKQLILRVSDTDGLLNGGRFIIRELRQNGRVRYADMAPAVPERALFLDCGRKYYSPAWIQDLIREISWAGMNTLVLHFSEDMGMRLESKLYPWLAGSDSALCVGSRPGQFVHDPDEDRILTQDDMRDIAETAKMYHVELVPSFDSPGHMNYIVKTFGEQPDGFRFTYRGKTYTKTRETSIGNAFHYNGKTEMVHGSGNPDYPRGVDISDETGRAFTMSLIEEYADFFRELGCEKFDIGGDELLGWGKSLARIPKWQQLDHWKNEAIRRTKNGNAVAYDAFLLYMNDLNRLLREKGYTSVRMWNDDAYRTKDTAHKGVVQLDPSIDIEYWTPGANGGRNTTDTYTAGGHTIYNYLNAYNYYVLKPDYPNAAAETAYNEWNPYVFAANGTDTRPIGDVSVGGTAFCIWCDIPGTETADQVMRHILPRLTVHAAKGWCPRLAESLSYADFVACTKAVGTAADPADGTQNPPFVLLKTLETSLSAVEALDQHAYTEESVRLLEQFAREARAVAVSTTSQMEIFEAVLRLETARQSLIPR